jgi:hypothetical protein
MKPDPSWEDINPSTKKNFPEFYRTRSFITVFTWARHQFLSRGRWIQSIISNPLALRSILILSFHLRLVFPRGLFPSGFRTQTFYAFLCPPMCATFPTHLNPWTRHFIWFCRTIFQMICFGTIPRAVEAAVESFSESQQTFGWVRNSSSFTVPVSPLSCSQEPDVMLYPEPA